MPRCHGAAVAPRERTGIASRIRKHIEQRGRAAFHAARDEAHEN